MASATEKKSKISIKVMVDKEKNRVVYAQADHTFVEILFSFMTLPLGIIVRQLGKQTDKKVEVLPSLNNLYQSLTDLPECYFLTGDFKSMLLNPRNPSYDDFGKSKVKIDDTVPKKHFVCENHLCRRDVFSICNKDTCKFCGKRMNVDLSSYRYSMNVFCMNFRDYDGDKFFKDISTFIVTDDLLVMPYTSLSCIQLLTELGVTNTTHLEERTVDVGYEKIPDLLRLSMSNISPLTYLVLSKKNVQIKRDDEFCTSYTKEESMSKMFLEVFLKKSSGKLLFAEVEEDFVDFVFGFFSISLGTLIGTLLNGSSSLVFMDNIFKSITSTDLGKYVESDNMKDKLLKPHFGQKIAPSENMFAPRHLSYRQNKDEIFKRSGVFKRPAAGKFMVTDELVITPSLSASTIDILNKFEVTLNDIETHKVSIDFEEALRILKASLTSKFALTKGLEHQMKKLDQRF